MCRDVYSRVEGFIDLMMNRKRATILVGMLCIGMILMTQLPPITFVSINWGIEEGLELTIGISLSGRSSYNYEDQQLSWLFLNNTNIVAKVTNLPILTTVYTSDGFIEQIVNVTKVECRFENGSSFAGDNLFIASVISQALLPIGGWNEIDFLYFDEYNPDPAFVDDMEYRWVSRFEDGSFFFAHQGIDRDGGEGWNSWINTTTGTPSNITIYKSVNRWPTIALWYRLILQFY